MGCRSRKVVIINCHDPQAFRRPTSVRENGNGKIKCEGAALASRYVTLLYFVIFLLPLPTLKDPRLYDPVVPAFTFF